jgi:hypothetical protein
MKCFSAILILLLTLAESSLSQTPTRHAETGWDPGRLFPTLISSSKNSIKHTGIEDCDGDTDINDCWGVVHLFSIENRQNGEKEEFRLKNRTVQVDDIFFSGNTTLVIFGRKNWWTHVVTIWVKPNKRVKTLIGITPLWVASVRAS